MEQWVHSTVAFNYLITSNTYVEPCNFKLFYQSLDGTLVESLEPAASSDIEEPIESEAPTANPTESVLPTDSEATITSEAPVESEKTEEENLAIMWYDEKNMIMQK